MKLYQYYQPNSKDIKDKYGDCTLRALTKTLNITWKEAFELCLPFMMEEQCLISGMPLPLQKKLYAKLGFTYSPVSNKKGTKRPTVENFAKEHEQGTFMLKVAHHIVAVVDGQYFDTWDCGDCCLYGYWTK